MLAKRWIWPLQWLLAAALLLGAAAWMWQQPLLADEWDFYRAMTRWSTQRHLIPHPQAYIHVTQGLLALSGVNYSNARLTGVLAALCTLGEIPLLAYAAWGRRRETFWTATVALWLYTLCPLTAQNMMLVDIDNTLLMPVLCGWLWSWSLLRQRAGWQRAGVTALFFALALWVKLPTPILLMGSLGLFYLLQKDWRRLGEMIGAALVGGGLFLATFALYTRWTGFSWAMLGPTLAKSPQGLSSVKGMLYLLPQGLGIFILWLSFPLAVLVGWALWQTVAGWFKGLQGSSWGQPEDLFGLYFGVTALFYGMVLPPAWGYPRYHAPLVPLAALLAARSFVPAWQKLPSRLRWLALGLSGVFFMYKLGLGDPLYRLYAVTFETDVGDLRVRLLHGALESSRLLVPLGLAGGLMLWAGRRLAQPWAAAVVLLGLLAGADMASTTLVQVTAPYSTRYRYTYDYADLQATLTDLEAVKGGYILALKDVLYYEGFTGEEIYPYVCPTCTAQNLVDKLQSRRIDALVWSTKEASRSPAVVQDSVVQSWLMTCYDERVHGVFQVYLRRSDCP